MAGNITWLGGDIFRLRISIGTGAARKVYSKSIRYSGAIDNARLAKKKYPKEILSEMAKFDVEIRAGKLGCHDNLTLSQFIQIWFEKYVNRKLALKTQEGYEYATRRIIQQLGDIKLHKLTPTMITSFYIDVEKEATLSKNTIRGIHARMRSILNKAVKWGYIIDNPAVKAEPPEGEPTNPRFMDKDIITQVLNLLTQEKLKYRLAITLDLFTGLRRGELCGLEWEDIDFNTGALKVQRASLKVKGIVQDCPLKTRSSYRTLIVPDFLIDMLHQHKREQDIKKKKLKLQQKLLSDNSKIFIQSNGKPMYPNTLTAWFPAFLRKNGLDPVNLHGIRHTFASMMIAAHIDIATAAALTGHARKDVLLNTYSHMFTSSPRRVADELSRIYTNQNVSEM